MAFNDNQRVWPDENALFLIRSKLNSSMVLTPNLKTGGLCLVDRDKYPDPSQFWIAEHNGEGTARIRQNSQFPDEPRSYLMTQPVDEAPDSGATLKYFNGTFDQFSPNPVYFLFCCELFGTDEQGKMYYGINTFINWELKLNIPNNDQGADIIFYEYCGGAPNESWYFDTAG